MAIWFLRFAAAVCLATVVGALGLAGRQFYRSASEEAAISAAQDHVERLGGTFVIDRLDGNYVITLHGPEIDDDDVGQLVGYLQPLPTEPSSRSARHHRFAFNLANSNVGDRGIQELSKLPLSWLNLNNTQITDKALLHLREQDRMGLLLVSQTALTRPAIEDLRETIPQLWIPISERTPRRR
jgi:hypothetical protein